MHSTKIFRNGETYMVQTVQYINDVIISKVFVRRGSLKPKGYYWVEHHIVSSESTGIYNIDSFHEKVCEEVN